MKDLAPHIFRQRLIVEGFYQRDVDESVIRSFFEKITKDLGLRTYGPPTIHATSGQGKDANQGYDAFVPLIDSGIYLGVWASERFLSTVVYTCKQFDERKALGIVKEFWKIKEAASKSF